MSSIEIIHRKNCDCQSQCIIIDAESIARQGDGNFKDMLLLDEVVAQSNKNCRATISIIHTTKFSDSYIEELTMSGYLDQVDIYYLKPDFIELVSASEKEFYEFEICVQAYTNKAQIVTLSSMDSLDMVNRNALPYGVFVTEYNGHSITYNLSSVVPFKTNDSSWLLYKTYAKENCIYPITRPTTIFTKQEHSRLKTLVGSSHDSKVCAFFERSKQSRADHFTSRRTVSLKPNKKN